MLRAKAPGLGPGEAAEGPAARSLTLALPLDLPGTSTGDLLRAWCWVEAILDGGVGKAALRVRVPVGIAPSVPPGAGATVLRTAAGVGAPGEHAAVPTQASRIPVHGAAAGAPPPAPGASGGHPAPVYDAA